MASKQEIVETLALLASKAFAAGETGLGGDINTVIAKHGGDVVVPEPSAATTPVAEEPVVAPQPETPEPTTPAGAEAAEDSDDVDGLDPLDAQLAALVADTFGPGAIAEPAVAQEDAVLAGLAAQIDDVGDDAVRAATPRSLTLAIVGDPSADEALATEIANGVLSSIIDVVGEVTVGDIAVGADATTVVLDLTDDNDGTVLAGMAGALGLDVFEAHWPVGDVTYTVTALAAEVADVDLARDLGLAAPEDFELPGVPDGQHPINGVLQLAADALGFRPEAATLKVTYRREGAQDEIRPELTVDQVNRVIAHPISQGGLAQFGTTQLIDVAEGATADAKVATFGLLEGGRIDPATLAVGAAAYRGTFDFGGDIGRITANAEVTLVDAPVDAL